MLELCLDQLIQLFINDVALNVKLLQGAVVLQRLLNLLLQTWIFQCDSTEGA